MTNLLDRVESARDLRGLTYDQLDELAAEMRAFLVDTVECIGGGGHLASNLGVVELSFALHRMFDTPADKIVWDVSHQIYVHKMLTGRKDRMKTIRQYGGLSGFADRSESEHDAFGAGHAGTSISAAVGMAVARDLNGEDFYSIAVIGDGAMTAGMALEAMNHAGHMGLQRFVVVLNDNAMSISPNVGALSRNLNKLRIDPLYRKAKRELGGFVEPLSGRSPGLGRRQAREGQCARPARPGELLGAVRVRILRPDRWPRHRRAWRPRLGQSSASKGGPCCSTSSRRRGTASPKRRPTRSRAIAARTG